MQPKLTQGASDLELGRQAFMPDLSWDDLRVFLSCTAQGSLRRASETLGVSASTIARALDRLERTVGYRLFARDKEGLRLTDDGRFMLDEVRAMERATLSIARRSSVGQDPYGESSGSRSPKASAPIGCCPSSCPSPRPIAS